MEIKNKYVYLKYGANVLRIEREILLDESADCSKYLEVLVSDGHGVFHFEKNLVSVLIAEDVDLKQLETTNNPLDFIHVENHYLTSNYIATYKKARNDAAHANPCRIVSLNDIAKKRLISDKANLTKVSIPTK